MHRPCSTSAGPRPSASHFFAGAFAWSWSAWLLAVALGLRADDPLGALLFLVGGIGPSAVALVIVSRRYSAAGRLEFGRRVAEARRIRWPWPAAIVLVGAAPFIVGWVAAAVAGEDLETEAAAGALAIAGVVAFALAAGIAEELGWRGVALDALRARWSWATAGVAIGIAWAVWHLPLYLLPGTFHHDLGLGSVDFWALSLSLVPLSVLFVWVCGGTRRSILAAILIHALGNASGELIPGDGPEARVAIAATMALIAIAVVIRSARRGAASH